MQKKDIAHHQTVEDAHRLKSFLTSSQSKMSAIHCLLNQCELMQMIESCSPGLKAREHVTSRTPAYSALEKARNDSQIETAKKTQLLKDSKEEYLAYTPLGIECNYIQKGASIIVHNLSADGLRRLQELTNSVDSNTYCELIDLAIDSNEPEAKKEIENTCQFIAAAASATNNCGVKSCMAGNIGSAANLAVTTKTLAEVKAKYRKSFQTIFENKDLLQRFMNAGQAPGKSFRNTNSALDLLTTAAGAGHSIIKIFNHDNNITNCFKCT
jgi:hypothetical protein